MEKTIPTKTSQGNISDNTREWVQQSHNIIHKPSKICALKLSIFLAEDLFNMLIAQKVALEARPV